MILLLKTSLNLWEKISNICLQLGKNWHTKRGDSDVVSIWWDILNIHKVLLWTLSSFFETFFGTFHISSIVGLNCHYAISSHLFLFINSTFQLYRQCINWKFTFKNTSTSILFPSSTICNARRKMYSYKWWSK